MAGLEKTFQHFTLRPWVSRKVPLNKMYYYIIIIFMNIGCCYICQFLPAPLNFTFISVTIAAPAAVSVPSDGISRR